MIGTVLAAGMGTRLHPLTVRTPKPLLRFLGKPFLVHQLQEQLKAGVTPSHVVVSPAHKGVFEKNVESISFIEQPAALGTADAARLVLEKVDGTVFLQYGDNLILSSSIRRLLQKHRSGVATIGVIKVNAPERYGVVQLNSKGTLEKIEEKPAKPKSNLVLAGLYVFSRDFKNYLEKVNRSERGEFELTDALNMAAPSVDVEVVEIESAEWLDLTFPWDVLRINRFLLDRFDHETLGSVEQGASIKGNVSIGGGSAIRSGAYVEGPVWIGADVVIGPNCYVRPYSAIDDGCYIGNACEIKASVVYPRTHIGHLSYVGDSVLSEDVNLGAGTVTANLRFDEKNVRVKVSGKILDTGLKKLGCFIGPGAKTGVNVSLNPGIKIGAYARIFPGCVVSRDIGDAETFSC
jgi:UDP-N-acetylglucosamine diphosphorylase/glucosamine-1-phosphate N-acetyltransferase